jgi:hypothetical protein
MHSVSHDLRVRGGITLLFVSALFLACRSHFVPQPTKPRYGGRFRFDLPVEFTLRGEGGHVKDVEIQGVTLPPAPSLEAARDSFWKQHIVDVRNKIRVHDLPPILDERELRPGVRRLSYRGYDEDDLGLESLLAVPGQAVLIKAVWRQHYKPAERPAQNAEREQAFNDVLNAFSFLAPDYFAGDPNAFYVKEGAVRIPYSASNVEHQERFEIGLDGKTEHMHFDFEYLFVERPSHDKKPGLIARTANAMVEWAFAGRSIRSRHRVVAGFPGEESLLHATKEHKVSFTWMYEPANNAVGFQPTITITGESDDGNVSQVTALWDQTLDGIQRLMQ